MIWSCWLLNAALIWCCVSTLHTLSTLICQSVEGWFLIHRHARPPSAIMPTAHCPLPTSTIGSITRSHPLNTSPLSPSLTCRCCHCSVAVVDLVTPTLPLFCVLHCRTDSSLYLRSPNHSNRTVVAACAIVPPNLLSHGLLHHSLLHINHLRFQLSPSAHHHNHTLSTTPRTPTHLPLGSPRCRRHHHRLRTRSPLIRTIRHHNIRRLTRRISARCTEARIAVRCGGWWV